MADERISIEITDSIASSIPQKINRIAASSRKAHTAVEQLQQQLRKLDGRGLYALSTSLERAANASNKLQRAQKAASSSAAKQAIEQQRVARSAAQTAAAQQRLSAATARTAAAQSRAAAAASRAEIAQLRLSEAQRRLNSNVKRTTNSFVDFTKRALSIGAIILATRSLIGYADAFTNLRNKLQNVTDSQEQVNYLTGELYELANRTRSEVGATATAFVRFDRALRLMGRSQQETLRMTETVNKALIVSGVTAQEAQSSLLQLSQAFNSGRLQGDEFRAVSENMPIALDAIAKALGKPVNEVKRLGTEGKITSDVLFRAFKLIEKQVDATFAKTVPTLSQAGKVFSNAFGEAIGKLDKALGFSAALARSIIWLSENLEFAALAVTGLSVALLAVFGPALIGMISTATTAVWGFTAALASNPIGLAAVAISSAVAALAIFGDEIAVSSDGVVTLMDTVKALFSYVSDAFGAVTGVIRRGWNAAIDFVNEKTNGWGEQFRNVGQSILNFYKSIVNRYISHWTVAFTAVTRTWERFPDIMRLLFAKVVNFAASGAELVVNSWQGAVRGIAGMVSKVSPEIGASINKALDATKLKLPRIALGKEAKESGKYLAQGVTEAFETDYVGNMINSIESRAREIAKARKDAESAGAGTLRGRGENTLSNTAGGTKKLTQEQKDYNNALKAVTAPLRSYNAGLAVANKLLSEGKINQDKYNALVLKSEDAYKQATDPLYAFNKASQEQLDILAKSGVAMQAERNVIQARNAALQAGLPFSDAMAQSIREMSDALDMVQRKNNTLNSIYSNTVEKQREILATQQAYNQALRDGAISAEQYGIAMARTNVEAANLKMQMGTAGFDDALTAGLGQFVSNYQGVLSGLSSAWGNFFTGFVDGFANSIGRAIVYGDDLQESLSQVSKQILSELIGALIKVGVQYAVNQALAQTAIQTTTATSTAAAAQTTAAWAPAAAVSSAGSFGGSAMAGVAALGVLFGMVLSFASQGFKTGGYTGDGGVSEVAGVVHGQEFVVNAEATRRNRATLEAMNAGGRIDSVNRNGNSSGGGASVVMVNFDIDNNITVSGGEGESSAAALENAATAVSQKTQADIMDSIRMGGTWSKVIKQVAQ